MAQAGQVVRFYLIIEPDIGILRFSLPACTVLGSSNSGTASSNSVRGMVYARVSLSYLAL